MNFSMDWAKGIAKSALAFGKKNLPSLMVGGSVGLQWLSLALMMIEAPKANEKIKAVEEQRKEDDLEPMTKIEKITTYGSYCWPSLVSMAGSTGLEIFAHKNLLNHVGELYMLAQLYKDDGDKLRKQILKEEGGEKKLNQYCDQIFEEEHPQEEIVRYMEHAEVPAGETYIFDETTGNHFNKAIDIVRDGHDKFNEMMRDRWLDAYDKAIKKKLLGKGGDRDDDQDSAFWSESDKPWGSKSKNSDNDYLRSTVYVTASLDEYLACIGEKDPHTPKSDIGEAFEFHYYGNGPCVDYNKVVDFKNYTDPNTGKVHYAVIRSLRQLGLLFISDEAYY